MLNDSSDPAMEQATRPRAQTPAGLMLGNTTVRAPGAQSRDGLP